MRNLVAHTKRLKEHRHPGAALGEFLIQHSNSPEYLVSNLRSFLECCEEDLAEEKALFDSLIKQLGEEDE